MYTRSTYIVLLVLSFGYHLAAQSAPYNSIPCENPPDLISSYNNLESQLYVDIVLTIEKNCSEIIEDYNEKSSVIYQNLGHILYDQEKYEQAIQNYNKAEQVLKRYNYPDPEEYGNLIANLSASHIKLGQFEPSEQLIDIALERLSKYTHELPVMVDLLYKKGTLLYHADEMDSSLVYFDSTQNILNSYPDTLNDYSINLHKGYSSLYKKLNKFKDAKFHDSIFLNETMSHYGDRHFKTADAYNRVARTIEELGDLNEAKRLYERALKIYSNENVESSNLATTYENLAYIDYKKADFKSASKLFERVYTVRESVYGTDHYKTLDALSMISLSRFQSGELRLSDSLNTILLSQYDEIFPPHHRSILNLLIRNSIIKHNLGHSLEGLEILHEAERRCLKQSGESHPYMTYIYANLGTIANEAGYYKRAKRYHTKALNYYKRDLEAGNPRISMVYKNLASDLVNLGEYTSAEKQLVKAIENLDVNSLAKDQSELFPIERVEIFKTYCRLHFSSFQLNQELSDLHSILKYGNQVFELLNSIRSNISDHDSQIKIRQNLNEVFEIQLYAYFLLKNLESKNYQKEIYTLIERSKNYDLHLQFLKEIRTSKLMDDNLIIDYNRLLKNKQTELSKKEKPNEANDGSINLASIIDSLSILENKIQSVYPGYFLHAKNESLDIDAVISSTSDSMCMINMFRGDSVVYISILSNVGIHSLMVDNLQDLDHFANNLIQSITSYHQSQNPSRELFDSLNSEYIFAGHEIYDKLVAPILSKISPKINHLAFLTDDVLNLIPFEILLTNTPDNQNFRNYPYLIKEYNISYAYLSTDLSVPNTKPNTPAKFMAFAPSFTKDTTLTSDTRSYMFSALKYNVSEVKMLKRYHASTYTNEEATKSNLIKILKEGSLIHLATHGNGNVIDGEASYLAMSPHENLENTLFHSREFYDHPIAADLVVLSACETGFGELKKNEGVISLSRGVMHAGAKSVISSLWSVNDHSTIDLFKRFYDNLDNGKSKAKALQLAKLNFINNSATELSAHPFYWAPFVIHGDVDPVSLPTSRFSYLVWLAGIILIVITIIFSKKMTNR